MAKIHAAERSKKMPSISGIIHNMKNGRRMPLKTKSQDRINLIQRISHPDYILLDWEFFSHELEFE